MKGLARGWKVAPNQPSPVDNRVFKAWGGFLLLIVLFYFLGNAAGTGVDGWLGIWAAIFVSIIPAGAIFYRQSFEQSRWSDSEYSPYASSDSSWGDDDDD